MNTLQRIIFLISSLLLITKPVFSKEFSSSVEATELIELYTSEGCSSCPPADKWLTQLKSNPQLFKNFIPLSFHVNYWNHLGWQDRFSKKQYSNRQFRHQLEGNISQAYTPGFVVNNEEWRNWRFGNLFHWPDSSKKIGVLKANYQPEIQQLNISFAPAIPTNDDQLLINIAVLGMDLTNDVRLGENRGRKLDHDFVVLTLLQHQVSVSKTKMQYWQVPLFSLPKQGQKQTALVVWLSNVKSQDVIQATGGYL